jgi:acyl-CoA hydrolase
VGELVSLKASVNYVGRSSMIVGIRVESQNVRSGVVKHTNSSFFTMVAKGDDDRPCAVPKLILESEEDAKRFIEGLRLKGVREHARVLMQDVHSVPDVRNAAEVLKHERCVLAYR